MVSREHGGSRSFFRDEDYLAFERVVSETLEKRAMRILAYCPTTGILFCGHKRTVTWVRSCTG